MENKQGFNFRIIGVFRNADHIIIRRKWKETLAIIK